MSGRICCGVCLGLLASCGGGSGDRSGVGTESPHGPFSNATPSARFELYQDGGHGPLTVSVDGGSSEDQEGSVLSYEWDFGDRAQATGVAASHTYSEPGAFTITLTVTDSGGASGQTAQLFTVDIEELVCEPSG